jgi:lysophospholipase L1-like esterase
MGHIPPLDQRSCALVPATIVLGLFVFCTGGARSQVRIMPLGDSITRGALGSSDSTGYRRALYQLLVGAGHSVDLVGSQTDGSPKDFDRNHEGHNGYSANQIRDTVTSWLERNPAEIILLHIGTNDITSGQNASGVAAEVGQILDRIDAVSTSIVVFLARIVNRNDSRSGVTTQYNLLLQSLADSRIAGGDLLFVVDQEAALSYPADLADAVHPNNTGYAKMAQCWFAALSSYLSPVPVQLSCFSGRIVNCGMVRLEWTTSTETNNYGFEVQRSTNDGVDYQTLAGSFVPGHGTSLVPHSYWYVDTAAGTGTCYYRLKQIDLDGAQQYSDGIGLEIAGGAKDLSPSEFVLLENYPNPFNPSTTIKYALPSSSMVRLSVYDMLGREVAVLVNERRDAGYQEVTFDAWGLSSGVYFCKLMAGTFGQTRRMILIK